MLVQSRWRRTAAASVALPLALAAALGLAGGPGVGWAGEQPAPPSGAPATPQERAAAIVAPAVVLVEVRWEGWVRSRGSGIRWDERPLSITTSCSGVTISNDGYVITIGDCVDAGPDGVASVFIERLVQRQVDEGRLTPAAATAAVADLMVNGTLEGPREGEPLGRQVTLQRGTATAGATGGDVSEARVVTLHPPDSGNIALLKMDRSNQPMVELAEDDAVPEDGTALALGYPPVEPGATVDVSVRPARVAAGATPSPSPGQQETPRPVYLRDAPGNGPPAHELEGAPAVNLDGQVIGLVTSDVPEAAAGAIVLANPAVLADDLEQNKVNNDLGKIDNDFRAGLDAYTEGRYDDSIRSLDDVLAALPTHQQAQELRQQAVALREIERGATGGEPAPPGRFRIAGWMIAVLAVIGALVGGAVWRRWRPAPPPATPATDPAEPDPPRTP
jgi:serine protease Do